MQIDKKFFITYKEVIMCVIIILIIFILGVQQIIAALVRVRDTSIELNKQKVKLNVANRELKKMQEQKQRLLFKQGKLKPFFEQVNAVNNSISSFVQV